MLFYGTVKLFGFRKNKMSQNFDSDFVNAIENTLIDIEKDKQ
jgi:hypothetical protein